MLIKLVLGHILMVVVINGNGHKYCSHILLFYEGVVLPLVRSEYMLLPFGYIV